MLTEHSPLRACFITSVLFCFALGAGHAAPKTEAAATLDGHVSTVPVTISHGHIFVPLEINGKAAMFVLDSGAGADVLSTVAAKRLGVSRIDSDKNLSARGVGGQQQVWLAKLDSLKVGGATLRKSPIILVDMPPLLQADGLLGYEFLHRFVTTVDYQAKTITLRDSSPANLGGVALPFVLTENVPGVDAELDGARGVFQIDTGDSGSIDVNTPFAASNHLKDKYPKHLDMVTGLGVGGEMRSSIVRIGSLTLGAIKVGNLTGDLSLQKEGAFADSEVAGSLGYDVLSRFRVTLDYLQNKIILEKSDAAEPPLTYNRSGLGFSIASGAPTVSDVIPGGPGEEAGVKLGEVVLEVNGTAVDSNSIFTLSQAVRGAPGAQVKLKLRAQDQSLRDVTVTLRELL